MTDGTVKAAWIGAITFLVVALIGLWQYLDGRRVDVAATVANPMPGLTVELDTPTNQQPVNEVDGSVRFNDVGQGPHRFIFRHPIFEVHVREFTLSSGGVTELTPDILLPASTDKNQRKGATLFAFALQHSDDASEPVVLQARDPPDPNDNYVHVYARASSDGRRHGWAYLQEGTVTQAMADFGSTTTLKDPVLLRTAPPTKSFFAEGYKLGKPSGSIDKGEMVNVQGYVQVNNSVWAVVTPVASEKDQKKKKQ